MLLFSTGVIDAEGVVGVGVGQEDSGRLLEPVFGTAVERYHIVFRVEVLQVSLCEP